MRTHCNGSTRATVRARRIGKRRKALKACERKDELRCLGGRVAHVGNGLAGAREGHVAGAGGRVGCGRRREGGAGRSRTQTVLLARNAHWAFRLVRNSVRDQPAPRSWELHRATRDEQRKGSAEQGDRQRHGRRTMRAVIAKSVYRARKGFDINSDGRVNLNQPAKRAKRKTERAVTKGA